MALGKKLESKIQYRIKRSKKPVFLIRDFLDLSDNDQIGRVLRKLISKQVLTKIGQGIYARVKKSELSNKMILEDTLKNITIQAFEKLNIPISKTRYERLYEAGETTQMPLGNVIGINKRVNRKIQYNGREIQYETSR